MGAFDDLIPKQSNQAGGAFDDLIPQERGVWDELKRQAGLTVRHAVHGVTGIPNAVGNALGLESTASVDNLLDSMGVPRPQGETERVVGDVTSGLAGGMGMVGLGRQLMKASGPVAKGVGGLLATNPATQVAASGTAGGAGGLTRENGGEAWEQYAAALGVPLAALLAFKAGGAVGGGVARLVDTAVMPEGATRAAGRVAVDVAKTRASDVVKALRAGEVPETAAEAAVPAGSAEFAGLQRMINKHDPSAYGNEGVIPTAQAKWLADEGAKLNRTTGPMREAELAAANQGQSGVPLKADPILLDLENMLRMPEHAGNDTARLLLGRVQRKLVAATDPQTGLVNADALYSIRKNVGNTIQGLERKAVSWDKAVAEKLGSQIQKSIDWSIERSSGNLTPEGTPAWEAYLQTHSKGAQRLQDVRNRQESAVKMAQSGEPEARRIYNADEVPVTFPNMLSRPMMMINAVLRHLEGYGGQKVANELAVLMQPQNKAKLAALMEAELQRRGPQMGTAAQLRGPAIAAALQGIPE